MLLLDRVISEIKELLDGIDIDADGEHLYSNYQKVVAVNLRLQELHNVIALEEINGDASKELKRVRTMIIDPTMERLDRVASYESRKITAKQIEWELEKKG